MYKQFPTGFRRVAQLRRRWWEANQKVMRRPAMAVARDDGRWISNPNSQTVQGRWRFYSPCLGLLLLGAALVPTASAADGGQIHGRVYADLGVGVGRIALPDIDLFLRNSAGTESPRVKSDLVGAYEFPKQVPGSDRVWWETPGWVAGCGTQV